MYVTIHRNAALLKQNHTHRNFTVAKIVGLSNDENPLGKILEKKRNEKKITSIFTPTVCVEIDHWSSFDLLQKSLFHIKYFILFYNLYIYLKNKLFQINFDYTGIYCSALVLHVFFPTVDKLYSCMVSNEHCSL